MVDMNMSSVTVEQILRKRENEFIEKRTVIEREVNMFLNSLANLDEELKQQINYTPGQNAQMLLPALWAEPFDMDKYTQQLNVVKSYISTVKQLTDKLNEEAYRCLQES